MNSALRLRDLIDDMVNVQHIEEGKAKLVLTEFALQDVVQRVVQAVSELYTAKEQEVLISLPPQPLSLKADRDKITLVLNNLLTNAIKFTDARGRIMISAERKNGDVQVHVADTGIGIPAREVERIFDRFYQVEPHLTRTAWRVGAGPGHRQRHDRIARRQDLGGECGGTGQPVLVQCAGRAGRSENQRGQTLTRHV